MRIKLKHDKWENDRFPNLQKSVKQRIRWVKRVIKRVCIKNYYILYPVNHRKEPMSRYDWKLYSYKVDNDCDNSSQFEFAFLDWVDKGSHSVILVVDHHNKTVELFDPAIDADYFRKHDKLQTLGDYIQNRLSEMLGAEEYKYIPPEKICLKGPQYLLLLEKYGNIHQKSCQYWTLFWICQRVKNPKLKPSELLEKLLSDKDKLNGDFLMFIAKSGLETLHNDVPKTLASLQILDTYHNRRM